jgi:acyl dehydratase
MISYEKLMNWAPAVVEQRYDEHDCILYALAHGLGSDPLDAEQLQFVKRPIERVFPTFPLALANADRTLEDGGTGIDYGRVVLGEQGIVLHRSLPRSGTVVCKGEVKSVIDKGPGGNAIVKLVRHLADKTEGTPLATMTATYVARGQGGFGGPPGDGGNDLNIPDAAPNLSIELATLPQQALLYDLTGDYVSLHVDPDDARAAGFERPILHGICTVGLVARAAMAASVQSGGRPDIGALSVRLGGVIFPGERLRFDLWNSGDRMLIRATAIERKAIVARAASAMTGAG